MAALIGTSRWDPFGESMLSIIQRIRVLNILELIDVARLIGQPGVKSFDVAGHWVPDNRDVLDLDRLCDLTGWQKEQLEGSFSHYYLPEMKSPQVTSRFEPGGPLEPEVRLCACCARQGVHLLCHQLAGWAACPVHHSPLIKQCPGCRRSFGGYAYQASRRTVLTLCPECNWGSVHATEINTATRREKLTAYRHWVQQIVSLNVRKDTDRLWIGTPNLITGNARVHALFPGPAWLSDCLRDSARVRTDQIFLRGVRYTAAPDEATDCLGDVHLACGRGRQGALIAKVQFRNERLVQKLINQRLNRLPAAGKIGGRASRSGKLEFSISNTTLMSRNMWWLWRWAVDELLPPNQRWGYNGQAQHTFVGTSFWSFWRAGPGRVAWRQPFSDTEHWQNGAVLEWVDRHWRARVLSDLFYAMLAVGGLVLQQDHFRDDGHVGHLMGEANELAGLPLSLLEADGNRVSLRTASTLAAPEVFEQFMAAECPGQQRLMISNPDRQAELFELLGLSAHYRALSRRACNYWASYLAGEPLTRRSSC